MTGSETSATHQLLDTVERSLTLAEGQGKIPTVLRLSRSYPTHLEGLWEACTSADRLSRWFAPVSGDLRAGGRFQVEGNAAGTIENCDRPAGFTATWEYEGEVSRIEVRLEAEDGQRTRLTLVHSADVDADWWAQYGPGAGGVGWDLALLGLADHLGTGSSVPLETTAWAQGEDGRQFIAGSSRRWAETSIAAGTSPHAAQAAGERTRAFYLGD